MAGRRAADAEMRIIGEDRPPGDAARGGDRPGVRAGLAVRRSPLSYRRRRRAERQRHGGVAKDAEIGVGNRRDIKAVGHPQRPCRAQRRHQRVKVEPADRGKLRAADLVVDIADLGAARANEIAHIPAQRHCAEDAIFGRQQRGIGGNFVEPGVDPVAITACTLEHVGGQGGKFGIEVAAIMEQPLGMVMDDECRAIGFGKPPHVAAMAQIELEKPVARDDIALAEKSVTLADGADVGNAGAVVDDLDRRAGTGSAQSQRLRSDIGGRCRQKHGPADKGATVDLHAIFPARAILPARRRCAGTMPAYVARRRFAMPLRSTATDRRHNEM